MGPFWYGGLAGSRMCRSAVQRGVPHGHWVCDQCFISECGVSKVKLRILLATVVFGSLSAQNPAEEVTFQI